MTVFLLIILSVTYVYPVALPKNPWGKYVIAYNKITKDRYLPTGPELAQSAQMYDISGEKMKLILDFPPLVNHTMQKQFRLT